MDNCEQQPARLSGKVVALELMLPATNQDYERSIMSSCPDSVPQGLGRTIELEIIGASCNHRSFVSKHGLCPLDALR
jgi:hypothetical protein